MTPQERTGVSLLALAKLDPEIWVVVDGGHPHPLETVGSGAGVIILQLAQQQKNTLDAEFSVHWQHYHYPLQACDNSTNAEIWAAVKGLEQVRAIANQKRICMISDSSVVNSLHRKLLVIELEAKYAEKYTRELETSPWRELADLYLKSQPCQILYRPELEPEGFNLVLLAAHQAAHELATKAALDAR